jgi:Universal stress protein family
MNAEIETSAPMALTTMVREQALLSIKNILLAESPCMPSEGCMLYARRFARVYGASISFIGVTTPTTIAKIVSKEKIDLVVIATGQKSQRSGTISVAENIVPIVSCPVMVIGPRVSCTRLAMRVTPEACICH